MNTRKTIYDKLFTEKVELAKHEVELTMLDDYNKLTQIHMSNRIKFRNSTEEVQNSIKNMQSQFIEVEKNVSLIDSQYQKFRRATLDLGVPLPENIENSYKNILESLKDIFTIFNKYNK